MNAIVLAAGFATRLYPLTRDRAKPLLEVGGRPVLSRLLDRVLALDEMRRVVVVTNGRFAGLFEEWRDGYRTEIPILLVNDGSTSDENRLGALADLALAWDALLDEPGGEAEDVLVVAGDNLIGFELSSFVERFEAVRRPLVMVRRIEGEVPPGRYGEAVLDSEGGLASFREKPADPRSNLAGTCFYLFPPSLRADLAAYLEGGGNPDAPGHFLEWLVPRRSIAAAPLEGSWYDIGDRESLEAARAAHETPRDGASP